MDGTRWHGTGLGMRLYHFWYTQIRPFAPGTPLRERSEAILKAFLLPNCVNWEEQQRATT